MKKKTAVAAVTVLLVCIAVYLNWSYQRDALDGMEPADGSAVESVGNLGDSVLVGGTVADAATKEALDAYFDSARLARRQARDTALSILENTLQGEDAAEAARAEASAAVQEIARNTIKEGNIEGIVLSKGYTNCLAYIGDGGLTVIVTSASGAISALDTAKITDIAIAETGLSADKIKIVEATPEKE